MHNACVWDSEETITKTQLAEKLTQANNMIIQVCFGCKSQEKAIQGKLNALESPPINAAAAEALAKDFLKGYAATKICRLTKTEAKLGRSLVIDVPTQGYRQVDHRKIFWLIMANVKYTLQN